MRELRLAREREGAKVENVLGKTSDWSLPLRSVNDIELVDHLVGRLLKLRSKPTAVFCPADCITAMVYRAFLRRGIKIGTDLSLISCNNELPLLTGLYPEVTTIDIGAEQIGRQAVDQFDLASLEHRFTSRECFYTTSIGGGNVRCKNLNEAKQGFTSLC